MVERRYPSGCFVAWGLVLALAAGGGCASQDYLRMRRVPRNPLTAQLQLLSPGGPRPTARTEQLLRRYDLAQDIRRDPQRVLMQLQEEISREPTPEKLYAVAELAYISGRQAEMHGRPDEAMNQYAAAVAHAYWYLFAPQFQPALNAYDPQFRGACDLYNGALEAALRMANADGQLLPGATRVFDLGNQRFEVDVVARGPWDNSDFHRLEFVSDYQLEGLTNHHRTFGLGVPMIAVRRRHEREDPSELYYPPELSFAVTAFLRVADAETRQQGERLRHRCVLELYDPATVAATRVGASRVPLESDLSTPLAYLLDNEYFRQSRKLATLGLLKADVTAECQGLYMLEPYDPGKIPVLMVHGLWSSPLTWMEMFNDLRSYPELRDRYQFWFYMYPTGQPFWVTAAQLRRELAAVRRTVDPQQANFYLRQLVLVGHSMGGLVSRLQVVESQNAFWEILSDHPFNELQATPEVREQLAAAVFFHPDPGIRQVITIGTPHRGSDFANDYTRWLGRNLIALPTRLVQTTSQLAEQNPGFFRNTDLLTITTSIDSLSPESPVFPVLNGVPQAPWVRMHNIVGVLDERQLLGRVSERGDGVVGYDSAHLASADSEIAVPASHTEVHQHPRAILEVRRVLRGHLVQVAQEWQQYQQEHLIR